MTAPKLHPLYPPHAVAEALAQAPGGIFHPLYPPPAGEIARLGRFGKFRVVCLRIGIVPKLEFQAQEFPTGTIAFYFIPILQVSVSPSGGGRGRIVPSGVLAYRR